MINLEVKNRIKNANCMRYYVVKEQEFCESRSHCFWVEDVSKKIDAVNFRYIPSTIITCTCDDFCNGKNKCVHIFFVLTRIMHITEYDTLANAEKHVIFEDISFILRNKLERQKNVEPRSIEPNEECTICYENLLADSYDLSCCQYCRISIHRYCVAAFLSSQKCLSCPICRKNWFGDI